MPKIQVIDGCRDGCKHLYSNWCDLLKRYITDRNELLIQPDCPLDDAEEEEDDAA